MAKPQAPVQELIYNDVTAALFEDGRLVEYMPEAVPDHYGIGAICYARITQIFKKQNRAQCQLESGEIASFRLSSKSQLVSGDLCWVTLSAMARQQKPWQAEEGISRAGGLIVLHYDSQGVRASHKAKGAFDEAHLKEIAKALPDGWGAVLKRASFAANLDEIISEIETLLHPVKAGLENALRSQAPMTFYQGDKGQDYLALTAGPELQMRFDDDKDDWEEREDLARHACEPEVILPNGAVLQFDQTRALLAVDVDSATSKLGPLACAQYVAPHIMRLIRLASYSGVILVDMPRLGIQDMAGILEVMRQEAQKDIRHPDVLGVSRAGLIEIVVRHRLSPLKERLAQI